MVRYTLSSLAVLMLGLGWMASRAAHADDLPISNPLMQRMQQEHTLNLPARGMSMHMVEHRYGAPMRKLSPRGGGRPHQPVINRWEYTNFIVYFERSHVIHTVLNTPAGNNPYPAAAH